MFPEAYLIHKINSLLAGLEYKAATTLIMQKQYFELDLDYLSLFH